MCVWYHLSTPIYLSVHRSSSDRSIDRSIYLSMCLSTFTYISLLLIIINLSIYPYLSESFYSSLYFNQFSSIYLLITVGSHLSIYLSIIFVYLSIYLFVFINQSINLSTYLHLFLSLSVLIYLEACYDNNYYKVLEIKPILGE